MERRVGSARAAKVRLIWSDGMHVTIQLINGLIKYHRLPERKSRLLSLVARPNDSRSATSSGPNEPGPLPQRRSDRADRPGAEGAPIRARPRRGWQGPPGRAGLRPAPPPPNPPR